MKPGTAGKGQAPRGGPRFALPIDEALGKMAAKLQRVGRAAVASFSIGEGPASPGNPGS
jgi:hypothetical protein